MFSLSEFLEDSLRAAAGQMQRRGSGVGVGGVADRESGGGGGRNTLNVLQRQSRVGSCVSVLNLQNPAHTPPSHSRKGVG